MFQEYTDTKIIKDMAYISVFVFFSVFVFIWYKHYGEKYVVKEKKDCPLMCGSFIEINRLAKRTLLTSGIVFSNYTRNFVQHYRR